MRDISIDDTNIETKFPERFLKEDYGKQTRVIDPKYAYHNQGRIPLTTNLTKTYL